MREFDEAVLDQLMSRNLGCRERFEMLRMGILGAKECYHQYFY